MKNSDSNPNTLELAKQGNPKAVADLLNGQLQPKGITAIVTKDKYFDKEERLKIVFEFEQAKSKEKILIFTQKFFQKLNPESVCSVMVYGRKKGNDAADWRDEIELINASKLVDNINSSFEATDLQESRKTLAQGETLGQTSQAVTALSSPTTSVHPSQSATLDDYMKQAQGYELNQDYSRAIMEMREAVKKYPREEQCHSYLADLYLKAGQGTMARIHAKRALDIQRNEDMPLISKDNDQALLKTIKPSKNKSRTLAVLLAIFFGGYGIHHFYLGTWGWGLVSLFLFWTNFALFIILGIVSGIIYLFLSVEEFNTVASNISGPFNLDLYKFAVVKLLKPKNSSFGLLRGLLWSAFGFFVLTSPFCLFSADTRSTGLKLAVLALITFPPTYDFISERVSNLLPSKYISKAGARNISYISACILFVYAAIAFTPNTYIRSGSSGPSNTSTSEDYPGQAESLEQDGREKYESLGECQDELIARGASVREIAEVCTPLMSEPEDIVPLTSNEVEAIACAGIVQDPSHPYYSDCIERGY